MLIKYKKNTIYLSRETCSLLLQNARKKYGYIEVPILCMSSNDVKKQDKYINSEFNLLPDADKNKYMSFDISGKQIKTNLWDVLNDYCCLTRTAHLAKDIKPFDIKETLNADEYNFPFGQIFYLCTHERWSKLKAKFCTVPNSFTKITIDANGVKRIYGTITNLYIELSGEIIHLDNGVVNISEI